MILGKKFKANLLWVIVSALTYVAAVFVIVISALNFTRNNVEILNIVFIVVAAALLLLFVKDDLINLIYVAMVDGENKKLYISGQWMKRAVYSAEEISNIILNFKDGKLNEIVIIKQANSKKYSTSVWTLKKEEADELAELIKEFCNDNEIPFEILGIDTDAEAIIEDYAEVDDGEEIDPNTVIEQSAEAQEDADAQ